MAVPKRRNTHSRAAKRRTHYKVTLKVPVKCKETNKYKLPHTISA